MTDSNVGTTPAKKSKLKNKKLMLVSVAFVSVGILVGGFFVVQNFISKYDKTQTLVSYGGFANNESKYDSHVKKIITESDEVLEVLNTKAKIVAVFEQPHLSGPLLVHDVNPNMKAKYVVKSGIYFKTAEDNILAKAAYISYYEGKGYTQLVDKKQESSPVTVLSRTFNPKSENSNATGDKGSSTKAEDKLIISSQDTDSVHKLSIMIAQTPDVPLAGLPKLDGNKTISESQKTWDEAKANKTDGCTLTPNSTFGGWRAEFGCVSTEDLL